LCAAPLAYATWLAQGVWFGGRTILPFAEAPDHARVNWHWHDRYCRCLVVGQGKLGWSADRPGGHGCQRWHRLAGTHHWSRYAAQRSNGFWRCSADDDDRGL